MQKLLNNISIKTKIGGLSIFLILLLCFSTAYSLYAMNLIGNELESIAEHDLPLTENLTKITEHQLEQAIHFERALRHGENILKHKEAESLLRKEIKSFKQLSQHINKEIMIGKKLINLNIDKAEDIKEKTEFEKMKRGFESIEKFHDEYEQFVYQVFNLLKRADANKAHNLAKTVELKEDELNKILTTLLADLTLFTNIASQTAEQHEKNAINFISIIAIVAIILGTIVSWNIASNIIIRLKQTEKSMAIIAQGDLTNTILMDGNDEIGLLKNSMQTMQQRLFDMISQISTSTFQISSASEEISVVMKNTSTNIKQQQVETDQVSSSMNEMSMAVNEVSDNVLNVSNMADVANEESNNGQLLVNEAVDGIQSLASQFLNTQQVVVQLEKDSENINTVLEVIKGIAEQTNLLALNAAIEAARAGEQGRGFAVVADEVRTLASRTQESTEEINNIIEKLQKGARLAVFEINSSKEQTDKVVEHTQKTGASLHSIASSVAQINQMSTSIATATEQQNSVAKNMSVNVNQINSMALDNASSVQQTTQAGEELAQSAVTLLALVEQFKV